ncbi:unnamed protein product [Prorocentrum cordatum]|uniref:Uncharacterized protein n=1 Tax=Prorocentrum cordatum TaxID=2364126 RepID=A0ABN9WJW6_9DINO|nr:unnamed protein product [Polarella glacialis]
MERSGGRNFGDPLEGVRRLRVLDSESGTVVLDELCVLLSFTAVAEALDGLPASSLDIELRTEAAGAPVGLDPRHPVFWEQAESEITGELQEASGAASSTWCFADRFADFEQDTFVSPTVPRRVRQQALQVLEGAGIRKVKRRARKDIQKALQDLGATICLELFSAPRVEPELRGWS